MRCALIPSSAFPFSAPPVQHDGVGSHVPKEGAASADGSSRLPACHNAGRRKPEHAALIWSVASSTRHRNGIDTVVLTSRPTTTTKQKALPSATTFISENNEQARRPYTLDQICYTTASSHSLAYPLHQLLTQSLAVQSTCAIQRDRRNNSGLA